LQYNEYKDLEGKEESDEYRLRVHKNGTRVIATYELDEGVSAKFRFEYDHKVRFPFFLWLSREWMWVADMKRW
jgi:hypothetical protein